MTNRCTGWPQPPSSCATRAAELLTDLEVVAGLAADQTVDATLRAMATGALARTLDILDLNGLAVGIHAIQAPLARVLALPARGSAHRVSAVGHAHIDSAWLWPLREARRTVANVLQLLDEHEELGYVMSAA